ncbi:PREDICTED: uncharacterized protein LOC106330749 [Brassica oleracea var. oleracea]|uniref:uncharacterized protein LOC106330749 n=1 Tax=Brassica oleracea var. oleracea TaxID=109376 RepID=UPI0006A6C22B|nr:PREDICTED: uncharacterized protein LOC106330749 [Brassica oleracea var. oleracea]
MNVSMWPDISNLTMSKPELIHVLRQIGPHAKWPQKQVKWPRKMKAPDSFWNPNRWYDFHHYHGHKSKDCVTLRIEVNELLKKGHLREFLSDKAKNLLNKETNNKTPETAPASPPRQDRVIHVISGGSEVSLLNEISFIVKEQERVPAPYQDALVISLTVVNYLVKKILVDNGSSSNILFQTAYRDLGLEENALTRRITPLIGFSGEVKQTSGEVILPVYAEGINLSTKFLVVE